ncbi:Rpn family recombination-promoting nuclease/putative transposase [Candidatus Poribacteria bacterium]|nr:Rpn family recombination-promoting nuclease/putative transposase [Candidatus Poribacteria bacterium]
MEYLDFSKLTELNRSYITDTLKELESDMVFSIPFHETTTTEELLIYILIEHQSTVDPMMGFRVLFYMCQIWDGQRRALESSDIPKSEWRLGPILPIVYYTGSHRWETAISLTAAMDVPSLLNKFVPKFDTLFLGVKDINVDTLTKDGNPFGWLLRVIQHEDADTTVVRNALNETLRQIQNLDTVSISQYQNVLLYLYQLIFFRRPASERTDLLEVMQRHTQDKEVQDMVMTSAELLIEKGVTQGIEQGIIQEKQNSVIRLIQHKFDEVPDSFAKSLREITDIIQLESLFDDVLNASNLDDIELPD